MSTQTTTSPHIPHPTDPTRCLKPFRLTAWIAGLPPGEEVVTRSGEKVRILCVDAPGEWEIAGVIGSNMGIERWREGGGFAYDKTCHRDDLFISAPVTGKLADEMQRRGHYGSPAIRAVFGNLEVAK